MEMLAEVERLTGQTIPSSILFEACTIRQLAHKLVDLDLKPKPVMQLNPNGTLAPLFLFHGDYKGGGLYALGSQTCWASDRPLYVIAPHDLGGVSDSRSMESIASDQLLVVRKAQPKGPYRLTGYCLWGSVAFEVARLLIAEGETVEVCRYN